MCSWSEHKQEEGPASETFLKVLPGCQVSVQPMWKTPILAWDGDMNIFSNTLPIFARLLHFDEAFGYFWWRKRALCQTLQNVRRTSGELKFLGIAVKPGRKHCADRGEGRKALRTVEIFVSEKL